MVHCALIVGGCGFIGRALMAEFAHAGWASEAFDRRGSPSCDLLVPGAADELARRKVELIVHAGGLYGNHSEAELSVANVQSTDVLLSAVARHSPRTRVVVIGSAAELGPTDGPSGLLDEREGGRPTSPYGKSKLQQSALARERATEHDLDIVRVRVFNTLGPGQSEALVAGAMVERLAGALSGGVAELSVSDPESTRDFLDVRDVARLVRLAVSELGVEPERPPLNVCSGIGTSIAALAGELLAVAGRPMALRFEATSSPSRLVGIPRTLRRICGDSALGTISSYQSMRDMWKYRTTTNARGKAQV